MCSLNAPPIAIRVMPAIHDERTLQDTFPSVLDLADKMHLNCLTQKCEDLLTDDDFELTTGSSATDCHSVVRWAHLAQKYYLVVRLQKLRAFTLPQQCGASSKPCAVCRHYKCDVSISCATIFIESWMTLCCK